MKILIDVVEGVARQVESIDNIFLYNEAYVRVVYYDIRTGKQETKVIRRYLVVEDLPTFTYNSLEIL